MGSKSELVYIDAYMECLSRFVPQWAPGIQDGILGSYMPAIFKFNLWCMKSQRSGQVYHSTESLLQLTDRHASWCSCYSHDWLVCDSIKLPILPQGLHFQIPDPVQSPGIVLSYNIGVVCNIV